MHFEHRAEWEWGWKTPLLLRFQAPSAVSDFLGASLADFALGDAEEWFSRRIAEVRSTRIGIRFERVQEALFRAHPGTESLRTGLVIPGRTEIDLLHRLRSLPEVVVHWEVAVKFYLGLDEGGSVDADRYIGPSLKDTLGKKTRTIFSRQLAILADPEIRAQYGTQFGISSADTVLAFPKVHGILFHPFRGSHEFRRPIEVAENGLRGVWLEIAHLPDFVAEMGASGFERARFRWLVDRADWIREQRLVSSNLENECDLKFFLKSNLESRLQSHFASGGAPIQGAILGEADMGKEVRFFIVPNGWHFAAERVLETLRAEGRIKT